MAHLIDVTVARGLVTLHGPIVVDEIDYLPKIIARIPGVQRVRCRLTVYKEDAEIERSYETRSGIPSLQDRASGLPRARRRWRWQMGSSLLDHSTRKRDYS